MEKEIKFYITDKHEFYGKDKDGNEYILETMDMFENTHPIYPVQIIKDSPSPLE